MASHLVISHCLNAKHLLRLHVSVPRKYQQGYIRVRWHLLVFLLNVKYNFCFK